MGNVSFVVEPKERATRMAFWMMAVLFFLVGWLHLGTPLLGSLFAYLALSYLNFFKKRGRWVAVLFFVVLTAVMAYGAGYIVRQSAAALPSIANDAIPNFIGLAQKYQIELPFTDYESLKEVLYETVTSQAQSLGTMARVARGVSAQFVLLIVGFVVAIGIFLNPRFETDRDLLAPAHNLYSHMTDALAVRFQTLYRSFATVMGAQIVISGINTLLTAIFVLATQLPHAVLVIGGTFLCGLLPVVGNLISNTIIVGIAITQSPKMAILALGYLVVIHKLEYFLNSKIVGDRIRNPFWLTLLALILGEKLMGIPGMILAPVVLHYVKVESSQFRLERKPAAKATAATEPAEALTD